MNARARLVLLGGLSGSGKSVALGMLEDLGYHTVDNLPIALIEAVVAGTLGTGEPRFVRLAIGVDPKSTPDELTHLGTKIKRWRTTPHGCTVVYLLSDKATLVKRYSATRRRHPLADRQHDLAGAIADEQEILTPLADLADIRIDSTCTNVHELRELVRELVSGRDERPMTLLVESFSYRTGVPLDADLVFDMRCLPNPHWEDTLRAQTGLDHAVIDYLEHHSVVNRMLADLSRFLTGWIPTYAASNRSCLAIAIGCTGGRHRSVFIAERLARQLTQNGICRVLVKHRELATEIHEATRLMLSDDRPSPNNPRSDFMYPNLADPKKLL